MVHHPPLWGTSHPRGEHARRQTEQQGDHHHGEGTYQIGLGGHQKDQAKQQGRYRRANRGKDGVVDVSLQGFRQLTTRRFTRQLFDDGAPAWRDEGSTGGDHQDQADQRDKNPAGQQTPRRDGQVEPGGEQQQDADPRDRA